MEQLPENLVKARSKVGVVIGSGGIRSLAALPLLEYFQKNKIPIDLLVGSGGGATLATLFAAGFSPQEIADYMALIYQRSLHSRMNYGQLMKMLGFHRKPLTSPPAPYKSAPLRSALSQIFNDKRIEDLSYRVIMQATAMDTGREATLSKGVVVDSIYASNAIYPFQEPINIDDHWLAAGMFTAALPIITAVAEQMDIIVVVDVNDGQTVLGTNISEYVSGFMNRAFTHSQSRQITLAISMHDGDIIFQNVKFNKSIGLWDVHEVPVILEAGKATLEKHAEEINEITSRIIPIH